MGGWKFQDKGTAGKVQDKIFQAPGVCIGNTLQDLSQDVI